METDRELLEMAAKAAGIARSHWDYDWVRGLGHMVYRSDMWNPLTSDGDALRLAVLLCMNIEVTQSDVYACTHGNFSEPSKPDRNAATRRAIVRAAAAIGEAMP